MLGQEVGAAAGFEFFSQIFKYKTIQLIIKKKSEKKLITKTINKYSLNSSMGIVGKNIAHIVNIKINMIKIKFLIILILFK